MYCKDCGERVMRKGNLYAEAISQSVVDVPGSVICTETGAGHRASPVERETWFHDRNYRLFGVLTGGQVRYQAEHTLDAPRGVPTDASEEVSDYVDGYGIDGHSHSYLTARELLSFDWHGHADTVEHQILDIYLQGNQKGQTGRVAEILAYANQYGWPKEWRGEPIDAYWGVSKENQEHVQKVEYEHPYAYLIGDEWSNFLVRIGKLAAEVGSLDDVRIVYFFDN